MIKYLKNTRLGIISILIGMLAMSFMDAMIKLLSNAYPLHEIVLVRSLVAMSIILIVIYIEGSFSLLRTSKLLPHIARGLLLATANMTFYLALSQMPLANVVAIFFISPVIITALSVLILHEVVGWHRWVAVVIGFIGVAIMMRLGSDNFNTTSILPLLAAFAYALTQIITRKIGLTEKTSIMSFYSISVFIFVSGLFGLVTGDGSFSGIYGSHVEFLFRPWLWPNIEDALQMIGIGFLIAIAGYMVTQAYRVTEVNIVAPFEYIALPMAVILGYLFWNEIPGIYTFLGMALVIISGLTIFYREQKIAKASTIMNGEMKH